MNITILKFCFAVEIGAYLAYVGHYKASNDRKIKSIMRDELTHMVNIKRVLSSMGQKPTVIFNLPFLCIGHIIRVTCSITPKPLLDFVARIMEKFNVVSYDYMAKSFPEHKEIFLEMSQNELDHEIYFKGNK